MAEMVADRVDSFARELDAEFGLPFDGKGGVRARLPVYLVAESQARFSPFKMGLAAGEGSDGTVNLWVCPMPRIFLTAGGIPITDVFKRTLQDSFSLDLRIKAHYERIPWHEDQELMDAEFRQHVVDLGASTAAVVSLQPILRKQDYYKYRDSLNPPVVNFLAYKESAYYVEQELRRLPGVA